MPEVAWLQRWALEREPSGTPDPVLLPDAQHTPVYPICQSTSAWRVWATWRGMALSNRRLECLPVACQKPEPRERLALRRGRDDCHFWLHRVSLQGTMGSARAREEKHQMRKKHRNDPIPVRENSHSRQCKSCLKENGLLSLC